jgi:hypothetical protein
MSYRESALNWRQECLCGLPGECLITGDNITFVYCLEDASNWRQQSPSCGLPRQCHKLVYGQP